MDLEYMGPNDLTGLRKADYYSSRSILQGTAAVTGEGRGFERSLFAAVVCKYDCRAS